MSINKFYTEVARRPSIPTGANMTKLDQLKKQFREVVLRHEEERERERASQLKQKIDAQIQNIYYSIEQAVMNMEVEFVKADQLNTYLPQTIKHFEDEGFRVTKGKDANDNTIYIFSGWDK